jgi:hypothetical protein
MTTRSFSTTTIGWMAIVTGVSAILGVIFLALMFTVNMFFGTVNDVFNSIVGISGAVIAWMLYTEHHAKSPFMSQIALALAMVGAIFTIVGSVLVIYGFTEFVLASWYSGMGYALIGLWLVIFCYSMQRSDVLPHKLIMFGLITGVLMAVGLLGIPGIFAGIDSMESLPWYLNISFFGYLGTSILYPIWMIWLGRNLLLK